jgi:hypothetical protein
VNDPKKRPKKSSRRAVWTVAVVLVAVAAVATGYRIYRGRAQKESGRAVEALAGRWMRPDGGYVLQLSDIGEDGSLRAEYFNPSPINVSQARWSAQDGWLHLFVELKDVNYPGSTYTLIYDPALDELPGTYYQAALQQTFEVRFIRSR